MKYLKRFNEELNYDTYKDASNKLYKLGYYDRARKLEEHRLHMEFKEVLNKCTDLNLPTFNLSLSMNSYNKITGDFYILFKYNIDYVSENYTDISLIISILPSDGDLFSEYIENMGHTQSLLPLFYLCYELCDYGYEIEIMDKYSPFMESSSINEAEVENYVRDVINKKKPTLYDLSGLELDGDLVSDIFDY